jgi:hypothetical protein
MQSALAQNPTIGLIYDDPRACPGYTLLAPTAYKAAWLIDNKGRAVHKWEGVYPPGLCVYMLENGNLLRTGRVDLGTPEGGGRVEEVDWDGKVVWRLDDKETPYSFHHDAVRLPNGNILTLAHEAKSLREAIDAGRDSTLLKQDIFVPDLVLELKPNASGSADIVWEWHFWDHMCTGLPGNQTANGRAVSHDVADPRRIDINFLTNGQADWLHCNGIDYNPTLDQIAISSRHMGEFYIVSHRTADYENPNEGIEAARGPDGDFLYRWGNPAAYGAGTLADQRLWGPHDIQWIADSLPGAGHFLIYNNGLGRPEGEFSTVEEIVPPLLPDKTYFIEPSLAFGPDSAAWKYKAPRPTDFYSPNMSGAQRLPNGNTLISAASSGTVFEVTAAGEIVWKYINPVGENGPMAQGTEPRSNPVFTCRRYPVDYAGFKDKEIMPGDPIELATDVEDDPIAPVFDDLTAFPNPANSSAAIHFMLHERRRVGISVFDVAGREITRRAHESLGQGTHELRLPVEHLPAGSYVILLDSGDRRATAVLNIVH